MRPHKTWPRPMSGQFFMLHIMKFDEAISCTFVRNLMEFWIIKIFHVKSIDQELNYAIRLTAAAFIS